MSGGPHADEPHCVLISQQESAQASAALSVLPLPQTVMDRQMPAAVGCRENNTGRFPRGLSLMLRSMSGEAWHHVLHATCPP